MHVQSLTLRRQHVNPFAASVIQPGQHSLTQAIKIDRFEGVAQSPRFQGKLTPNPYLKGFLTLALGLGAVLGPAARIGKTHEGHDHEILPPPREQVMTEEPVRMGFAAQPDVKRYEHLEGLYKTLKEQPKGSTERSQTEQRIRNSWNSLANESRNGNLSSKMTLQALWVNRMYEELTEPSEYLVRQDYEEYTELVNDKVSGKLTKEAFNTEVQWRALLGLYCYYRNGIADNPLTQDVNRLYEPVTQLLANNPHPKIQMWGGSLMNILFPKLDSEKQTAYLQAATGRYLSAPAGSQKLSAMKGINWLYSDSPAHPHWKQLAPQLRDQLKTLLSDPKQVQNEDIKYHITVLGMIKDVGASEVIREALGSAYPVETQGAAVWTLGRLKNRDNFDQLVSTIHDSNVNPLVREHAIYSLAEYSTPYEAQVWQELNRFKTDEAKNEPQALKDAARAMRDMLTDRYQTDPDYYINKLLGNEQEKARYKSLRDQYVTGWQYLNTAQKNMVDRALLPYRHFLQEVINNGGKHHIITGVVTDLPTYKNFFGKRIHDGRLNDTIEGMSSATLGAVTNRNRISPAVDNTFAHEFIHHIHQLVMNHNDRSWKVLQKTGLSQKIVDLYRESLREKRILDYYGATNEYENLAQGGEAMDAQYRKHSQLYNSFFNRGFDSGSDNSRSKLKRQDPKLYEFLESIRCIPLEISIHLFKTHVPEMYAQVMRDIGKDSLQNVA